MSPSVSMTGTKISYYILVLTEGNTLSLVDMLMRSICFAILLVPPIFLNIKENRARLHVNLDCIESNEMMNKKK